MGGQHVVATGRTAKAEISVEAYNRLAAEDGAPAQKGAGASKRVAAKEPPVKLGRRRSHPDTSHVSMFRLRGLWFMPFLAEVILLFGALWMSYCLLRIVQEPKSGFPLGSVLVLAVAYAGLALYSRLQELFLPRKIVFIGIGALLLIAVGVVVFVLGDAFLVGGSTRLVNAALILTPVHLFVLRCLLVFREARFAPSAASLAMRLNSRAEKLEELRRKLRFWMN